MFLSSLKWEVCLPLKIMVGDVFTSEEVKNNGNYEIEFCNYNDSIFSDIKICNFKTLFRKRNP